VSHPGYVSRELAVPAHKDIDLGAVELQRI